MVRLLISPRGNHGADSTLVEWELEEAGGARRRWSLTRDAIRDLLTTNPEADSSGNAATWYFVDARGGMAFLDESIRDHAGNAGFRSGTG